MGPNPHFFPCAPGLCEADPAPLWPQRPLLNPFLTLLQPCCSLTWQSCFFYLWILALDEFPLPGIIFFCILAIFPPLLPPSLYSDADFSLTLSKLHPPHTHFPSPVLTIACCVSVVLNSELDEEGNSYLFPLLLLKYINNLILYILLLLLLSLWSLKWYLVYHKSLNEWRTSLLV